MIHHSESDWNLAFHLIDITFLPRKGAPRNIVPITYHVNQWSSERALKIAKAMLKKEHGKIFKYYKDEDIAISETRVI